MYHISFIHSSVDGHLDCFHVLTTVISAAVNTGVHASFWTSVLSANVPGTGIPESHGNAGFSFLRNLHTVFRSGCNNLHSHQQKTTASWLWQFCNKFWKGEVQVLKLVFLFLNCSSCYGPLAAMGPLPHEFRLIQSIWGKEKPIGIFIGITLNL